MNNEHGRPREYRYQTLIEETRRRTGRARSEISWMRGYTPSGKSLQDYLDDPALTTQALTDREELYSWRFPLAPLAYICRMRLFPGIGWSTSGRDDGR